MGKANELTFSTKSVNIATDMIDPRILEEPNALKLSIREMRQRCQSTAPAPERETYTGKCARFFSIYFTRILLRTPLTPNQITFISVLVFLTGVGLFLMLTRSYAILGAGLVFFATVLDGCDGEMARFRKMKGPVGGYYAEPVSHDVQYGMMFFPLGLAASLATHSIWWLAFGFVASVSKLLTRLLDTRYWFLLTAQKTRNDEDAQRDRQQMHARPRFLKFVSWLKRNTLSSNGMIFPLFLAAWFDRVTWYVAFYAAMYALLWAVTFLRQLPKLKAITEASQPGVPGAAD